MTFLRVLVKIYGSCITNRWTRAAGGCFVTKLVRAAGASIRAARLTQPLGYFILLMSLDDWTLFGKTMRFIGLVIGALAIFCSAVGCARHFAERPSTSSKSLTFTIVSAGQDHTCGLTTDGDVY